MTIPSQPLRIPPQGKIPRRTSPASFFGLSIFRFVTLAALLLTQPSLVRAGNILKGCATSYDPTRDYFPEKVRVTEAEDFGVEYHLNYKLATNFRTGETFALYQCGTPAPAGLNSTIKVFPVPFQSVGLTTTIEISFLEKLGLTTAIKYISGPEYISSPCLQALITSGETLPFSSNSTVKAAQEQSIDGVFVYSKKPSNPKHISVSTSLDPGALHRAEWIGFLGLFFNAEASAETIFDEIQANFDCVSNLAKKNPSSPVVAWVSYAGYQINKYTISTAQYKLDFVEALGATPLAPQVHEFDKLDDWKAAMANVDIVIDETYLGNIDTFFTNFGLNSDSTTFKFVKNGQVWGIDKLQSDLGALDWFETAVASPDAVLQDLYTIVKPEDHFNHTRIWLRDSFHREAPVTTGSEKCPNPSAALVSPASPCPPLDDGSGSGFALVHPFGFLVAFCLAFIALLTLA